MPINPKEYLESTLSYTKKALEDCKAVEAIDYTFNLADSAARHYDLGEITIEEYMKYRNEMNKLTYDARSRCECKMK